MKEYQERSYGGLSIEAKAELWARWRAGESMSDIGRAFGKHPGSIYALLQPQVRLGGEEPLPVGRLDRLPRRLPGDDGQYVIGFGAIYQDLDARAIDLAAVVLRGDLR